MSLVLSTIVLGWIVIAWKIRLAPLPYYYIIIIIIIIIILLLLIIITIGVSLILGIHIMVNWQLSKQTISWWVSHDHVTGSGFELIEVACIFEVDHWPGTVFFYWNTASSQVITLGEKEWVWAKAKFWCKLTPGAYLTFLPTYSLHNRLVSSLKFNGEKIAKPHGEQLHAHNWSFFGFLIQEHKFSFVMISYCNQEIHS